jgi:hypothetical protein
VALTTLQRHWKKSRVRVPTVSQFAPGLTRFLEAGDPDNKVATSWRAKESLEELYTYRDPDLASEQLDALTRDFTDNQRPPQGPATNLEKLTR